VELPSWLTEAAQLVGVVLSMALLYALQVVRKRFEKQLDRTETKINEVAVVTNGRLEKAMEDRAAAIESAQAYRLLAERWCQIVKELNTTPEGRTALDGVMQKYRTHVHDTAFEELLSRLMHQPPSSGGTYD
jgi:hypothetical protein